MSSPVVNRSGARRRGTWVLAIAALVLLGACGSGGGGDDAEVEALRDRVAELEEAAATTTTETPTTTAAPATVAPTTVPPTTAAPTTAAPPRGSLRTLSAPTYGQGFPSGPCANWRRKFVNNSSAEIVEITFAPPSAQYSNFSEFNKETQQHAPNIPAEKPAPTKLNVSIPPGGEQVLAFQSCTRTPPPENPNYQFGTTKADSYPFMWVTGHRGVGPAADACQSPTCK